MNHSLFDSILKIAAVHMSVLLVPGQNFVLVAMYTLDYSLLAGLSVAAGATIGMLLLALASVFGVSAIIREIPALYLVIKYAGACYLVYLGAINFRKNPVSFISDSKSKDHPEFSEALKVGVISSLLNVRAVIYLIGLFSQIKPSEPWYFSIVCGCEVVFLTGIWFGLVSIGFSKEAIKNRFLKNKSVFHKLFSGLLVLLGIIMFFD